MCGTIQYIYTMHSCISVIEHKLVHLLSTTQNETDVQESEVTSGKDGQYLKENIVTGQEVYSYTVNHIILSISYPCKIIHVCLCLHLCEPGNIFGG